MAKLQDKFFNRVIEGDLELESNEKAQVVDAIEKESSLKVFENIVDAQGHKRFVEGKGTINALPTGFEILYNKWGLSGTHLMFVIYIKNPSEDASVGTYQISVSYNDLPQWIKDKIYTPSSSIAVCYDEFPQIVSGATSTRMKFALMKDQNEIKIIKYYQDTFIANAYTRIVFDLFIDNEAPAE